MVSARLLLPLEVTFVLEATGRANILVLGGTSNSLSRAKVLLVVPAVASTYLN